MIVKLTSEHVVNVKQLFYRTSNYMGVSIEDNFNLEPDKAFEERAYEIFCDNYLSDLDNFHTYGSVNEITGNIDALISFYEADDEPAWYFTVYRSIGNNQLLKDVLDSVIDYNESNGRLKFYTLVNKEHSKLLRRFTWSKYNDARYDYVDECLILKNHKPLFQNHWELLFKRILLPVDTVVRCNFLKQEHRPAALVILGNI